MYRLLPATVSQGPKGARVCGYRPDLSLADLVMRHGQTRSAKEEEEEGEEEEEDGGRKGRGGGGSTQRGLVVVEPGEEWAPVWGAAPFFAPETPTSAVEDLLLLHTRWGGGGEGVESPADSTAAAFAAGLHAG